LKLAAENFGRIFNWPGGINCYYFSTRGNLVRFANILHDLQLCNYSKSRHFFLKKETNTTVKKTSSMKIIVRLYRPYLQNTGLP